MQSGVLSLSFLYRLIYITPVRINTYLRDFIRRLPLVEQRQGLRRVID